MDHEIKQEITVNAPASAVYALLTQSERFAEMSGGAPTTIDPTAGGAFSCFGGMIHGRNIECIPDERLVQAWRAKTWDSGVYSVVRLELEPHGTGTLIRLTHAAFPSGQAQHLSQGWHANYWEPLRKALG